jgi:hypothetical protein
MKNYDRHQMFRSPNRRAITIGNLKADRLAAKNRRRAANGQPPKSSYADI